MKNLASRAPRNAAKPRGWSASDVQWFLAQIAKKQGIPASVPLSLAY